MDLYALMVAIIQLFIITDPVGNLPIFETLTKKESKEEKHKTYLQATFVGFALLVVFAVLGNFILSLFHITLPDFKIAGGILLLIIAILILVRGSWIEDGDHTHPVGAVPMGVPILVGPGAITTAMVLMGLYGPAVTLTAIVINFGISFFTMFFGDTLFKLLGERGSEIIARVLTILLAAIAVHYIRSGIMDIVVTLR
jgi:multiple antibiotic resistance protein